VSEAFSVASVAVSVVAVASGMVSVASFECEGRLDLQPHWEEMAALERKE
jgi:hypothetical protein